MFIIYLCYFTKFKVHIVKDFLGVVDPGAWFICVDGVLYICWYLEWSANSFAVILFSILATLPK